MSLTMWLWLTMGVAWSESWSLRVPRDQGLPEWEDALLLTGLVLAEVSAPASLEVVFADGGWWLQEPRATWRRTTIPAPNTPAAREEIARQARNMLADRGDGIESRWEPLFPEQPPPLAPDVSPPPAAAAAATTQGGHRTPPPQRASILVPRYGMSAPGLGHELPEAAGGWSGWVVPLPAQVISSPWALRPPPAYTADAGGGGGPEVWWRLGVGPSWRPDTTASLGVLVESGVTLGERWSLGLGGSWQARATFSSLEGARAVQGTGIHTGMGWRRADTAPLQLGAQAGVVLLRFQQEGVEVDRLLRPQVGGELSYGTRIQVFGRISTEMWPVSLEEKGSAAALGVLLPVVWVGIRLHDAAPAPLIR